MALGTWLSRRWAIALPVVALTGWQLLIGGMVLAPWRSGRSAAASGDADSGGGLSVAVRCRGDAGIWPVVSRHWPSFPVAVSAMSLLSPVTAVLLGWIFLGQKLREWRWWGW
jgi:probable blue pigment (indigoidine) exporter